MMTVRDLINELEKYDHNDVVKVAIEVVEGHDVRTVLQDVDEAAHGDGEVILELG